MTALRVFQLAQSTASAYFRAQNWAKKLGANWLLDIFSRSQHRNLGAIWFINCTYLVAGMQRVLAETEIYAFHGSCNQQKCIDKILHLPKVIENSRNNTNICNIKRVSDGTQNDCPHN